jgi:hypothetical protein
LTLYAYWIARVVKLVVTRVTRAIEQTALAEMEMEMEMVESVA